MLDDLQPTEKGPGAGASDATPPAPGKSPSSRGEPRTGGLGLAPGTGGFGGSIAQSVPSEDLSDDKLIHSAPRVDVQGKPAPVLGGIPLLAKLGQGGMGAVYYGIHPRLETEVAVKVLPMHLAQQQPEAIQRFYREAQIAANIQSPHLVSVSDVNNESGVFYLIV